MKAIYPQVDFEQNEIIVPFDKWSREISDLIPEFPEIRFHFIEDLGLAASEKISAHQHRLFDRRRAVGLGLSRGRIIAMTEDHAVPAENWCEQILLLHEKSCGVIGGAIENKIDSPLNWAWYYCDFGRFGRPLPDRETEYVSDINVAYKREAIMSAVDLWRENYHETTVHWALRAKGVRLLLDETLVVYQARPRISLSEALRERVNWGRVFAETRAGRMGWVKRLLYAAGTSLLPPLLTVRVGKHMLRQKRSFGQMATTMPLAFLLLVGWSWGEMLGYLAGDPQSKEIGAKRNSGIPGGPSAKNKLAV